MQPQLQNDSVPSTFLPVSLVTQRGRAVQIRPMTIGDYGALILFYCGLSAQTIYLRYFMPRPAFDADSAAHEAQRVLAQGPQSALIALIPTPHGEEIIGLVELSIAEPAGSAAEVAVVVSDAYQSEGIGSALCSQVRLLAHSRGVVMIEAMILHENQAIPRLLARLSQPYSLISRQGVRMLQVPLSSQNQEPRTKNQAH
jgi:RimJ/RimL family protein N-acetyltransferase